MLAWVLLLLAWATTVVDTYLVTQSGATVQVAAVTVLAVTVAGAWLLMPWAPTSSRSWLLTVAYAGLVLLFGYATDMTWAQGLLLVTVANAVFVLGAPRAAVLGATLLPAAWAAMSLSQAGEISPYEAAFRTAGLALVGAVVIGLSQVVVAARRDRARADSLLAELQERSERIAELSAAAERTRLTRDIHDSLGHHLTVANLQLLNATRGRRPAPRTTATDAHDHAGSAAEATEHDDPAWNQVAAARLTVRTALDEVRRSVRAFDPPPLARTLPDRLKDLVSGLQGTAVTVHLDVVGHPRELPPDVSILMYRAVQEGLTNAVSHSSAGQVQVRLSYEPDTVWLSVDDDGGDTAPAPPGYGLSNLRARALGLGGTLDVGPRPGGYRLHLHLPTGQTGG